MNPFVISTQSCPFYARSLEKQGSSVVVTNISTKPILVKVRTNKSALYHIFPCIFPLSNQDSKELCISLKLSEPLSAAGKPLHQFLFECFPISESDYCLLSSTYKVSDTACSEFWGQRARAAAARNLLFAQTITVSLVFDDPPSLARALDKSTRDLISSQDLRRGIDNIGSRKASLVAARHAISLELQKQASRIEMLEDILAKDQAEYARVDGEVQRIDNVLAQYYRRLGSARRSAASRYDFKVWHLVLSVFGGLLSGRVFARSLLFR